MVEFENKDLFQFVEFDCAIDRRDESTTVVSVDSSYSMFFEITVLRSHKYPVSFW